MLPGAEMTSDRFSEKDCTDLFTWASRQGVEKELANLLIACRAGKGAPVNMSLQFLADLGVRLVLDDWKEEDVHAAQLASLSDALVDSPMILEAYHANPKAKPLKLQLYGDSTKWPLLLCLGSRRLSGEPADQSWFEQLRVWTLIQGYRLALVHGSSDLNVAKVAFRLRQGADDGVRRAIESIKMLRSNPPSVEALSRHVRWAAARKSAREKETDFPILLPLEQLAAGGQGKPQPKPESDLLHEFVSQLQQRTQAPRTAAASHLGESDALQAFATTAMPAGILSVDMEEGASHTRGLLSGRWLQLRKVEELQFLPWSWEALTPPEAKALKLLIVEWELQKKQHLHLLAFLTRVAILTSRSLELASSMIISDEPVADWTVTSDLTVVHRLPPRRSDGWQAEGRQYKWIRPLADALRIDTSASAAKLTPGASKASTLDDLWRPLWPRESAGTLFRLLCKTSAPLGRVSSDRLAGVLGTSVYGASQDGVLAQLLSSRPTTALGGNAAYPSWPTASVKDAFASVPVPGQVLGAAEGDNAVGSRLNPLERGLRRAIRLATARLASLAADPDQWIEFHNGVVTYVVGALLCATGARPVTDPFESPLLFDWVACRVFLCDKASEDGSGRLVPLPKAVLKLVEAYCEYLLSISQLLLQSVPALALEIERLGKCQASTLLPFFFFLRARPALHWYSVSSASLTKQRLFVGPLPWNLARHRLPTRLRAAGVDPEVIDSILGHADRGVLTHGDESPRTWHADMEATRPALESTYLSLGFSTTLVRSARTTPLAVDAHDELIRSRPFGTLARKLRREQLRKEQTRSAVQLFKQTVAGRSPADITSEEWDDLALKLLTVDGRRPHPYAAERYETLQSVLTVLSTKHRLKLRRIFTLDKPPKTPFRESAIGSEQLLVKLQQWFEGKPSNPPRSQCGPGWSTTLAALDLLLVSRVTCMKLLEEVLLNKKPDKRNFRIVVYEAKAYIEYHPQLHEFPNAPVVRHRVSWRCATWLSTAQAAYKKDAGKLPLPKWAQKCPILQGAQPAGGDELAGTRRASPTASPSCGSDATADVIGTPASPAIAAPSAKVALRTESGATTVQALVAAIAEVVEQANFIQRPGIIAAYAAGRLGTSALPHEHWVLHTSGKQLASTAGDISSTQEGLASAHVLPSKVAVRLSSGPRPLADPEAASLLFKDMLAALESYRTPAVKGGAALHPTAKSEKPITHRRELATRLAGYLAEREPVSSAIRCLATWIISLVEGHRMYAISTVVRYLRTLHHRFVAVGIDFDLVQADSDEVLDFYDEVVEVNRDLDLSFVGARLQAFHAFVCKTYGVQVIDWGELDCWSVVPHGSPGWIGEEQYFNALQLLVPDVATSARESVAAAFLLILSYRAGLRGADAIGLRARDWLVSSEDGHLDITVCVRSNTLRDLKSPASRRIVPPLEPLTEPEKSIVREFTAVFESLRLKDATFPLFAKETTGERFTRRALVDRVNDVLAEVHGYRATMHMGRHSFGSRVARLLMADLLRPPDAGVKDPQSSAEVRRTLLGTERPTRRAPWALARALGHSRPSVTFKSYVHWIHIWSDEWNASLLDKVDGKKPKSDLRGSTNLDKAAGVEWTPRSSTSAAPATTTLTLASVGRYLELVRHGCRIDSAARAAGISTEHAARIDMAIEKATEILKPRARQNRAPLTSILSRIDGAEWGLIYQACVREQPPATPAVAVGKLPAGIKSGLTLLSANRQLVVWEKEHYLWVAEFARRFSLPLDAFTLRTPRAPGQHQGHIKKAKLEQYAQDAPPGKIDSVVGPQRGRLDRCAFAVRGRGGTRTGTGLALMWAIYLSTFCH